MLDVSYGYYKQDKGAVSSLKNIRIWFDVDKMKKSFTCTEFLTVIPLAQIPRQKGYFLRSLTQIIGLCGSLQIFHILLLIKIYYNLHMTLLRTKTLRLGKHL